MIRPDNFIVMGLGKCTEDILKVVVRIQIIGHFELVLSDAQNKIMITVILFTVNSEY